MQDNVTVIDFKSIGGCSPTALRCRTDTDAPVRIDLKLRLYAAGHRECGKNRQKECLCFHGIVVLYY